MGPNPATFNTPPDRLRLNAGPLTPTRISPFAGTAWRNSPSPLTTAWTKHDQRVAGKFRLRASIATGIA